MIALDPRNKQNSVLSTSKLQSWPSHQLLDPRLMLLNENTCAMPNMHTIASSADRTLGQTQSQKSTVAVQLENDQFSTLTASSVCLAKGTEFWKQGTGIPSSYLCWFGAYGEVFLRTWTFRQKRRREEGQREAINWAPSPRSVLIVSSIYLTSSTLRVEPLPSSVRQSNMEMLISKS